MKVKPLVAVGCSFTIGLPALALAQSEFVVELVADINQTDRGSYPHSFLQVGTRTFFVAEADEVGRELWMVTDEGTTQLVKDIVPGAGSSAPMDLVEHEGYLYFIASTAASGRELWRSDGTDAGTVQVAEVGPGERGILYSGLTSYNGDLYFVYGTDETGPELWKYDGTKASLVIDLEPGPAGSIPSALTVVPHPTMGDVLVFEAQTAGQSDLWISQGTSATTEKVAGTTAQYLGSPVWVSNRWLYFTASLGLATPAQLWRYEPATGIVDKYVLPIGAYGGPSALTNFDNQLYFVAEHVDYGWELWRHDGVAAQPTVIDLTPGPAGAYPSELVPVGETLYFHASSPASGEELWAARSVATGGQITMVADIAAGPASSAPRSLTRYGNDLLFSADDGEHGRELWLMTNSGASMVKDILPGPAGSLTYPLTFYATSGGVYFEANDGEQGGELWRTDGTEAGTSLVVALRSGTHHAFPSPFVSFNGAEYFSAYSDQHGLELFVVEGATARLVKDIIPGPRSSGPAQLTVMGSALYFLASDEDQSAQLWRTDGTEAGTVKITNWDGRGIRDIVGTIGERLLLIRETPETGRELWVSDGTAAGTMLLLDINPGPTASLPDRFAWLGGYVYFSVFVGDLSFGQNEVWRTDGTASGTSFALELDRPTEVVAAGDAIYYLYTGFDTNRIVRTDGTPGGTYEIYSHVTQGTTIDDISALSNLAWLEDIKRLVFSVRTKELGWEPWISDGTQTGTMSLGDLNPGVEGSHPSNWAAFNGAIYFSATDGVHGQELWRHTPGGAVERVTDVAPGAASSSPVGLTVWNGKLFMAMDDGQGSEIWMSDGTTAGTQLVRDLSPWGPSYPQSLFATDEALLFVADDGVTGLEVWRVVEASPAGGGEGDGEGEGEGEGDDEENETPPPPPNNEEETPRPSPSGGGGGGSFGLFSLGALIVTGALRRRYPGRRVVEASDSRAA